MFDSRPILTTMLFGLIASMQTSAAQSDIVTVNFYDNSHYIFTQHPADASEWLCIVGKTREIHCARISQYYQDSIEYTENENNTFQHVEARYD